MVSPPSVKPAHKAFKTKLEPRVEMSPEDIQAEIRRCYETINAFQRHVIECLEYIEAYEKQIEQYRSVISFWMAYRS